MLILMECILDLVVLDLFLVVGLFLKVYQLLLTTCQQISGRNLASKISLSVLLSEGQNLSWLSRFFLLVDAVFNHFGCSEVMLRKVWRPAFFLNILVCKLLFLIYISVSRNEILSFDFRIQI